MAVMCEITEVATSAFPDSHATYWPPSMPTVNRSSVIIVFPTLVRDHGVTTMNRPFKFLLFIFAIQRYHSVDGYAPGGLIWSPNLQNFIPIANISTFGAYEQEIVARSRETKEYNFQGGTIIRYLQKFVPIDNIPTSDADERAIVAKSRKYEKHNFRGKVLKLAYFEEYNMVNFIANNTKITGVCGDILNTLAEYLNFTLVTRKVDEITKNKTPWIYGVLGTFRRNKTQIIPRIAFTSLHSDQLDFTMPIWETRCKIYIKPEWKSDANWIFNIFECEVWFAILFCTLILSALGYLMQNVSIKVSGDKKRRHNLHDHVFYTLGTLCSRGSIPETLDRRSKILDVSKKMFAGLLLIVLGSHMIPHMTKVKLRPPFDDLESLLNKTEYTIDTYESFMPFEQYLVLLRKLLSKGVFKMSIKTQKPRVAVYLLQNSLHKLVCEPGKRALFELEDTKQAFGNRYCEMVAVDKSYLPTWISFGVPKGFKYRRTFDIGILKMREFGLIDRLKKRWLKTSDETVHPENLDHAPFMPINLDQVLMLFIILGIGMAASATILVLEIVVSIYKSNGGRPVSDKMLVGKASLNAHYKKNRMRREIEP